uniref:CKLF like MARVEL transmembrane domain containing 6 n=1 Tax=Bos taurus TaxID=9913 RepID=A0AAA9TGQ9_BOVIN
MENGQVYRATTEAHSGPGIGPRSGLAAYFTLSRLTGFRRLKLLELVLSLLAFICEEVVSQCTLCGGLYFFEFVSCSAFLLSLLILVVYCTPVYDRVDPAKVKSSDFFITLGTGLVFFVASLTFTLTHDNTIAEIAAILSEFQNCRSRIVDLIGARRRQWQATPVLLPGESQGQGSLVGCCLWGRTESDTTEAV